MMEGFKPDLGIYVKENFVSNVVFQFMNLELKNIFRIGPKSYTLYTDSLASDKKSK